MKRVREIMKLIVECLQLAIELMRLSVAAMRLTIEILQWIVWGAIVAPPGFGSSVQLKKEVDQMGKKVFTLRQELLPVPETNIDAVKQRLIVSIDGVERTPIVVDRDATGIEYSDVPEGAAVHIELDYLDEHGRDSGNVSNDFVVVDELPPDAPTGLGATVFVSQTVLPDEVPPVDTTDETDEDDTDDGT